MTNFMLAITFEPADLKLIALAGQSVTIVNRVSSIVTSAADHLSKQLAAAPNDIVWLAFSPFESNQVTWTDDYDVYASREVELNGASIMQSTNVPALQTKTIPLEAQGVFGAPLQNSSLPTGVYGIANHCDAAPYFTFGLGSHTHPMVNGQAAETNDILRMNAAIVLRQQTARFTPTNSLQVFLQTGTSNGMLLPNPIQVPPLQFSANNTKIHIKYNAQTSGFDVIA